LESPPTALLFLAVAPVALIRGGESLETLRGRRGAEPESIWYVRDILPADGTNSAANGHLVLRIVPKHPGDVQRGPTISRVVHDGDVGNRADVGADPDRVAVDAFRIDADVEDHADGIACV